MLAESVELDHLVHITRADMIYSLWAARSPFNILPNYGLMSLVTFEHPAYTLGVF